MLDWLENQRPPAKKQSRRWETLFSWIAFAGTVGFTFTRTVKR